MDIEDSFGKDIDDGIKRIDEIIERQAAEIKAFVARMEEDQKKKNKIENSGFLTRLFL